LILKPNFTRYKNTFLLQIEENEKSKLGYPQ
jgi:hypothetical protein